AHVRAKPGYVAAAAHASPTPVSLEATLNTALGSGLNVSGLTLHAFVAPMAATAKGMSTIVTIEVTYPVPVESSSRRIDDDLQIGIVGLDGDGRVKASSHRPWRFTGPAPAEGVVTFLVDDAIDLPAQPLTLRIAAASRALAKAGMVQLPVDV